MDIGTVLVLVSFALYAAHGQWWQAAVLLMLAIASYVPREHPWLALIWSLGRAVVQRLGR